MNSHKFAEAKQKFSPTKWSKYVIMFSGAIIIVGIIMIAVMGFNLGMDFTGGNIIQVQTNQSITDEKYEEIVNTAGEILSEQGLTISQSQREGQGSDISVSIQYQNLAGVDDMSTINNEIIAALEEAFPEYTVIPAETKSATASSELLLNALLAVVISLVFLLVYIAIRFEFLSGIAALLTLFHDVLIMIACVTIFQIEINSTFIAAIITVLGYSINNTIIIFDRVRENLRKPSLEGLSNREIADLSVRQTLNRTLNTSITTIVSVFLLLFTGISQLTDFVLPILIGLIAGTYASIFISAPLWTAMMSKSSKFGIRQRAKVKAEKKAEKEVAMAENQVVDAVAKPIEE